MTVRSAIDRVLLGEADWSVVTGDALDVLREMPDECVNTIICSPPYWGLRDYGTGTWEGGDPSCRHTRKNFRPDHSGDKILGRGEQPAAARCATPMRGVCTKCGARRVDMQIGLEESPEAYLDRLTEVFVEAKRVLRSDGTCWINIGDSNSSSGRGLKSTIGEKSTLSGSQVGQQRFRQAKDSIEEELDDDDDPSRFGSGLGRKNMLLLPARLALALQAKGWYVRADIIWAKTNPQPESVKDRPTRSHEHLWLLSKARHYAYDPNPLREPHIDPRKNKHGKNALRGQKALHKSGTDESAKRWFHEAGRNARDVWALPTQRSKSGHPAPMPRELIRRCVLAGCPDPRGIVLDPFAGGCTTGLVAKRYGRRFIGIDLSAKFTREGELSLAADTPLLEPSVRRRAPAPEPAEEQLLLGVAE